MADDKSKRGGSDRSKINIHEDYEVRYWKEKSRDLFDFMLGSGLAFAPQGR
jgi:hypothetical protein